MTILNIPEEGLEFVRRGLWFIYNRESADAKNQKIIKKLIDQLPLKEDPNGP